MDLEFRELFEQLGPSLYRLAYSYVKNRCDAEDAVQEAFLRLLSSGIRFRDPEARRRWLMKVTVNRCRDLLRSAGRRREVGLEDAAEAGGDPALSEELSDVRSAIFALPEKYRVVVLLHYYEGLDSRQIAKLLRITPSTVLTRLSRAREQLKKRLGGDWNEG